MKQSSAPLYRGWYGCDLVKFGEMLTASRTCAVGIGVLLTDLTGTFSRNDESANGNLDINQNGVMLTNRMRIKLPRHPPTMSPVLYPASMPLFITLYWPMGTSTCSSRPITARHPFLDQSRPGCALNLVGWAVTRVSRGQHTGARTETWSRLQLGTWSHFLW